MSSSTIVHVLDSDHTRRAQIARSAYGLGYHAEVYASAEELAAHAPRTGVVIALDDAIEGGVGRLVSVLNRNGRCLAVIATSAEPSIDKAVAAIREGASDYLELPLDLARLAQSIDMTARDSEGIRARGRRRDHARQRLANLSDRELQVVEGIAAGRINKEIGRTLGISPRTVEIHRTNAIAKLGAGHSAKVVRIWIEAEADGPDSQETAERLGSRHYRLPLAS